MDDNRRPLVSVIVVNFRTPEDTIAAVRSVMGTHGRDVDVEAIVVENASGDASATMLREALPTALVIEAHENLGFAGGCHLGVERASGEYIAFLNPDAVADDRWLSAAVAEFDADPRCGAVASRVLTEDGDLVDFVGAGLTWFGMGTKPYLGVHEPRVPMPRDVLFGTGAAMVVRSDVWQELGGFDQSYFMFFEDVDFGWRLNLAGYRFAYVRESMVRHRHHGSMGHVRSYREQYLLERNALFTLYKNLGAERLFPTLSGAMALTARRAVAGAGVDSRTLDIRNAHADDGADVTVPAGTLTATFAIDQFVSALPTLEVSRARIQASRLVPESRIIELGGELDVAGPGSDSYQAGYEAIMSAIDPTATPARRRALVITGDPLAAKLAGPAIRAWHIASELAVHHDVRLVSLSRCERTSPAFTTALVLPGDERSMASHVGWADVVVFQGLALDQFRTLRTTSKPLVVDIYDPIHIEHLEQSKGIESAEWERRVEAATTVMTQQLSRGDFFMCASERQRMFWLGHLASISRVNPTTYRDDPTLESLVSVVPFGLPVGSSERTRRAAKGVLPGIEADAKLILWSGGLYDWFDPLTLVRAVAELAERCPNVRLLFLGAKNPNPSVGEMPIVEETRALARELGVLGTVVHINDDWVEYDDRHNYLLDADVGVSTHKAHLETTLSFRTRILDYLWCAVPMVVTDGDFFADLVRDKELGVVVAPADVSGLAEALERVLFDDEFARGCTERIEVARRAFEWPTVLGPLLRFVENPVTAADLTATRRRRAVARRGPVKDARLALHYLRTAGPRSVWVKVKSRLRG